MQRLGPAGLGGASLRMRRCAALWPALRSDRQAHKLGAGFQLLAQRGIVSLTTVLDKADSVLACYAIVQRQVKPTVKEEPGPGEGQSFKHVMTWSWDGKEITTEATARSKKLARNGAARSLLHQLVEKEPACMDPTQHGALAQWAVDWINQRLEATVELDDAADLEEELQEQSQSSDSITHRYIWTCPQLQGESYEGSATAKTAVESRWKAMSDLYNNLPSKLDEIISNLESKSAQAAQAGTSAPSTAQQPARVEEELASRINAMHNAVVQKLGINWTNTFEPPDKNNQTARCTLRWDYFDSAEGKMQRMETHGEAIGKQQAKAQACAEMLQKHGHIPMLSADFRAKLAEVKQLLAARSFNDATAKACEMLSQEDSTSTWFFFMPDVLRALLAEGDEDLVRRLLDTLQASAEVKGGVQPVLWERLLDEASFSMRHYHVASMSLDALQRLPLMEDATPGPDELNYFVKFRHLLAFERHGGLLHGIQEYELDPKAFCSVPTVDVHRLEADMVMLTTTPGAGGLEMTEGARPLKASDIVLLVPMEAISELEGFSTMSSEVEDGELQVIPNNDTPDALGDGETLSSGWRHPEAWIASVTSLKGNPRVGENLSVRTRRISQFGSDAEQVHNGTPIAIGRQYRLFYLAMETPMGRMLSAVRNLCKVQMPVWSDDYEGRKPSYTYKEEMNRLLLSGAQEAKVLATEAPRMPPNAEEASTFLERLIAQRPALTQLTESQRSAVLRALEQRLSLIQGPPGTGKTHVACAVIATWVERYGSFGERILAVADSNVAADNLHTRLASFGISSTRVGMGKEVETLMGDRLWAAVRDAQVVVATCIGSGMEALEKGEGGQYQRVVIDECTQACEPAAIISMGRNCEQVVLIGDHAQLPATVLSKVAKRYGLGISLFERMVDINNLAPTILTEQRRMHSSIAEFPNIHFYDSRLVNAVEDSTLDPVPGFNWPNPDCRVAFVDVGSETESRHGFSRYNSGEANCIAEVLKGILNAGFPVEKLCILTPYQAQKHEIFKALREAGLWSEIQHISIDTIDGYQGMERDLVLFSATRSNAERSIGFLADARRMNVMLTRARRGIIVFGDGETLRNSTFMQSRWGPWYDWVQEKGAITTMEQVLAQPVVEVPAAAVETAPIEHPPGGQASSSTPSAGMVGLPPPPPAATPAAPKEDWEKVYSEEYKQFYYWEKISGATQWEVPDALAH